MTLPEVRLWVRLRQPAEGAPRFRRQHPLGPYVLDFYCPAAKLCVEVDGWGHNMGEQPARDEAARGIATLRVPAADVLVDPDGVADAIVRTVLERV
jgi:very-short-patch-repair endonuclease